MKARAHAAALWVVLTLVAGSCALPSGASKGEIVIASLVPLSGGTYPGGGQIQAGIAYALRAAGPVRGFTLVHAPYDDAVNAGEDRELAARNVSEMVADPRVLGVVGPFQSGVARATIPITSKAELVMVSPSNTSPCLTRDIPACAVPPPHGYGWGPASLRDPSKPNNYFRVSAGDFLQGPAMADYAIDVLKVTKAAVWSDSLQFGGLVADGFAKRFEARGGAIVLRQDLELTLAFQPKDFTTFFQRARDAGAQAIYAGAQTGTQGCAARAQAKGILDVYYLGSDGIGDNQCIKDAADQANDKMYFTIATPLATQDSANKGLIEAFTKAFPQPDDLGAFTFLGYDSAMVLIDAIGRAIDAAGGVMPTRRQVLDAVQNTKNLKLSSGTYAFDKNGDATAPLIAVYHVKNGAWTFVKQFPVAP